MPVKWALWPWPAHPANALAMLCHDKVCTFGPLVQPLAMRIRRSVPLWMLEKMAVLVWQMEQVANESFDQIQI